MKMITSFKTISGQSEGFFKDRGSKFLAFAYPVKTEDEIKEYLEILRKEYHDARHHCYAWKLGTEPVLFRANDDGEPSNSAGKPILNQIEKYELTDILIVVIRYFGGILLGVGGLINAYRTAAAACIQNSEILTMQVQKFFRVDFKYPQMNDVMKIIKEFDLESSNHVFELSCSLIIRVNLADKEKVISHLDIIEDCSWKEVDLNNF
mgnify:CR=1 FL=1